MGRNDDAKAERGADKLQPVQSGELITEATPEKASKPRAGKQNLPETFVYIGPTVPRSSLKENALFRGTKDEVHAHLGDILEKYPRIKLLIVAIDNLAVSKDKLAAGGNAMSVTYRELTEAFAKSQ